MYQCRRPVPRRQTSIGPWLEILVCLFRRFLLPLVPVTPPPLPPTHSPTHPPQQSFITWFGTLTNASLVHLYRPLPIPLSSSLAPSVFTSNTTITTITYSSTMRLASVSTNPLGAIQSALLTSLLVALLASQSWFVFRGCTSLVLTFPLPLLFSPLSSALASPPHCLLLPSSSLADEDSPPHPSLPDIS